MKNRSKIIILSVLACFGVLSTAQAGTDLGGGNTANGFNALNSLTTGGFNTADGWYSQAFLTTGFFNTAVGAGSLDINNGSSNSAFGTAALLLNIVAERNTAVGTDALIQNDFTATSPATANDNTAVGFWALLSNLDGFANTAVGSGALQLNDSSGAGTANLNTAVGTNALNLNVNAGGNTAMGTGALENNDSSGAGTAVINTAVGVDALFLNVNAGLNTAVGAGALGSNDFSALGIATDNTAVGALALVNNIDGADNTAVGAGALVANVAGNGNTAVGRNALNNNIGGSNVAVGERAAENNTIGAVNTAVGSLALTLNTTGTENTAVGRRALENLDGGHQNTAVGWGAGMNYTSTETRNICIGDAVVGVAGENDNIRIGDNLPSNGFILGASPGVEAMLLGTGQISEGIAIVVTAIGSAMTIGTGLPVVGSQTFMGGIVGTAQPSGGGVIDVTIDTNAGPTFQRLGIDASSRRYKDDVKPMDKLSEAIYKLKPVTYRVKKEINPAQPMTFGLIAEDVAEVCSDLATYSDGQPLGVHYKEVSVMLLNEFLKEHKKVEEQQAAIAELKSTVGVLTAQLKEQAAQIQKVSAQLEVGKPAPQVVVNKP
jgi:hypothetical protein